MSKALITFIATLVIEILITCCTNIEFGVLIGIPLVGGFIVYYNQKN